jgi:hypothetical protein
VLEASIEAAEQLAIYYEHRAKQSSRAADLIRNAIAELQEAQNIGGLEPARASRIESRLARRLLRLDRACAKGAVPNLLRPAKNGCSSPSL